MATTPLTVKSPVVSSVCATVSAAPPAVNNVPEPTQEGSLTTCAAPLVV